MESGNLVFKVAPGSALPLELLRSWTLRSGFPPLQVEHIQLLTDPGVSFHIQKKSVTFGDLPGGGIDLPGGAKVHFGVSHFCTASFQRLFNS